MRPEPLRLTLRRLALDDVECERLLRETEPLLLDREGGRELTFDRDFPDELWPGVCLADCRLPLLCTGTATVPEGKPVLLNDEPERTGSVRDLPCLAPER